MSISGQAYYQTQSAVLFVVFNRPEQTQQVFERIRHTKPARLYISADGPRERNSSDERLCKATRAIVNQVDWPCKVQTLFNDKNKGCRLAVSAAISWFFAQESEGIILEDDCLPANSFFMFCDTLLEKYRNDTRIRHITGCNLQFGKKWGSGSYYFSNRTHVWGWAGWRRVWDEYDINLKPYDLATVKQNMLNIYPDDLVANCWTNIFKDVQAGKINSWAYPLDFVNFFNNGLVIIPNQNLISNIGFKSNGTNTFDEASIYANIPLTEIEEIFHPEYFIPEKDADLAIIKRDFKIEQLRKKQNKFSRRLVRWLKLKFN